MCVTKCENLYLCSMKAQIIPLAQKKDAQVQEEKLMTPEERMLLAFQLIELAKAFASEKAPLQDDQSGIKWINLRMKDGQR